MVQFPKSLLNLTHSSNVTSVTAYLTLPKLPSEDDSFLSTVGVVSTKTGRRVREFADAVFPDKVASSALQSSGSVQLHLVVVLLTFCHQNCLEDENKIINTQI